MDNPETKPCTGQQVRGCMAFVPDLAVPCICLFVMNAYRVYARQMRPGSEIIEV
jgi:hypothetical protein